MWDFQLENRDSPQQTNWDELVTLPNTTVSGEPAITVCRGLQPFENSLMHYVYMHKEHIYTHMHIYTYMYMNFPKRQIGRCSHVKKNPHLAK